MMAGLDTSLVILALLGAFALGILVCCLLGWWALGAGGIRQAFQPDRGDDRFHRR